MKPENVVTTVEPEGNGRACPPDVEAPNCAEGEGRCVSTDCPAIPEDGIGAMLPKSTPLYPVSMNEALSPGGGEKSHE